MRRVGPWVAVAIVLVANATMLLGEWRNRSGAPDAEVVLTERELPLAWRAREDSGRSLRLDWSSDFVDAWFDEARLAEVGFDVEPPLDARSTELHYERLLPRDGFVVLEMEGAAWERWRAEREEEIREAERRAALLGEDPGEEVSRIRDRIESTSRLFAVDAGLDPAELRRRHPDRGRLLILPAVLDLRVVPGSGPEAERPEPPRLEGAVAEVRTSSIHVPLERRDVLDAVEHEDRTVEPGVYARGSGPPRYEVTLAVGSRLRPWIRSVRRVAGHADGTPPAVERR